MGSTLHLDIATGRLTAAGIVADAGTRAERLPPSFAQTAQAVQVEGRLVDCVFARATATSDGMAVQLELRFEADLLVSCFLSLSTPALRKLAHDDFYGSVDQRHRLHQRWLASMGVSGGMASFPWGRAGVARDRDDNVHIYVHNLNNLHNQSALR